MNELPSISLVTCSYQQGRFLDATMRSVLEQDYPGLEYVVIDGGSKDESVDVIRRHEARLAHWVSEADKGQTDALIKGFRRVTGDVMGWLCSDDLLLPNSLAFVGRFFAENPQVDALYGDSLWIDAEGRFIRAKRESGFNRFVFLFDHNFIPQPSMFWRRSLYEKVGGLDARFNLAMDSDLWERFSRATRIVHVPEFLSCMRYYPEQKTRALRPAGAKEDQEIRSRHLLGESNSRPLLRAVARVTRIASKAAAGGYRRHVPEPLISGLARYRIVGDT